MKINDRARCETLRAGRVRIVIKLQVPQSAANFAREIDLLFGVASDGLTDRKRFLAILNAVDHPDQAIEATRQECDAVFMRPERIAGRRRQGPAL